MTNLSKLLSATANNNAQANIYNLPEGSEIMILREVLQYYAKTEITANIIHICKNDKFLDKIYNLIKFFIKDAKIIKFPAPDTNPYDKASPKTALISQRIKALNDIRLSLKAGERFILLTTAHAVMQRTFPVSELEKYSLTLNLRQEKSREDIINFLVENSYQNVSIANEAGEFSVRGSIIDIIASGNKEGVRVDFFGNEIESIRYFDPITQITTREAKEFQILPASEVILSTENSQKFKENYLERFGLDRAKKSAFFDAVENHRKIAGLETLLPLFYDKTATLIDYLTLEREQLAKIKNPIENLFFFEQNCQTVIEEYEQQIDETAEARRLYYQSFTNSRDIDDDFSVSYNDIDELLDKKELFVPYSEILQSLRNSQSRIFYLHDYQIDADIMQDAKANIISDFKRPVNINLQAQAKRQPNIERLRDYIIEEINDAKLAQKKVNKLSFLVACMSSGSRERVTKLLEKNNFRITHISDIDKESLLLNKDNIGLIVLPIDHGFICGDMHIISEGDLFGDKIYSKKRKNSHKGDFLKDLSSMNTGELVVHREFGIGKFLDLVNMDIQGINRDFVMLEYSGGDKLYVPVENLDILSKFGNNSDAVALDKLGSNNWQERTARVKNRIRKIAMELIEVAAQRELQKGEIYESESGAYDEFCAKFPYMETDDQQAAIEQVLTDLESGKPMDRLVCGDVGFGKTEVALRAAFIVSQRNLSKKLGKSLVAVVCPTTLLCRQHYKTFQQRFDGFGFNIKQLSRLVTSKEERETKEQLKKGEVDIVIGTHALFSDSIEYKDISLLIVDEEQRFGVKQKEKLKTLKAKTHILTLSATPIPRTLQLSLSGVRELSLITTPPVDRLAVRTYVMPFDKVTVREAILKEYYRGGKIYFVAPRIKDVNELEKKLAELVPEIKIVVAHGQMSPSELDKRMNDFYDGKYDLLLATTIVESGLDVPSANTIIIHRADMFGLSQLYQIRGRVGRGKERAYAYLTTPRNKTLTKTAKKRLDVMQKLDSLGAGFTLASYDMDIRGFGNLLGDEQSGNIKEVGLELYQSMLSEMIEKIRLENKIGNDNAKENNQDNKSKEYSVKINLGIPIFIPQEYIADTDLRMSIYRKLSDLYSDEDIESYAVELTDRFGKIPQEVENLIEVVKVKQICKRLNIEKIETGDKGAVISFYKNEFPRPDDIIKLIAANPTRYKVKDGNKLVIANMNWGDTTKRINELKDILVKM